MALLRSLNVNVKRKPIITLFDIEKPYNIITAKLAGKQENKFRK